MAKDYANKNRVIQGRKRGQEPRFVPLLAAILGVICFLGVIIYSVHLYHQTTFFSNSKEHVTSWFNHAKTMMSRKDKAVTKTPQPQASAKNDEIQFDFYTELPSMQVNMPASAQLKSVVKTVQADHLATQIDDSIKTVMARKLAADIKDIKDINKKAPLQFILQLGEFSQQVNASQLRLSLLLAGIETEVIKLPEHKFRVQQGPYASERQAKLAQNRLSRKGFESSIKSI